MKTLMTSIQEESIYVSREFCQKIQESTSLNYTEGVTFYEKMWEILNVAKEEIGERKEVDIKFSAIFSDQEKVMIQAKQNAENSRVIFDLER